MKRMKKLASLLLAIVMVLSMTVAAFAEEIEYKITVTPQENSKISLSGNTYYAYKLFDVTYASDKTAELGYAYTIAEAFKDFEYVLEEKDEEGKVTNTTTYSEKRDETGHIIKGHLSLIEYVGSLGEDSDALNKFAEKVLAYAEDKTNNVPVISQKATDDSVVINVGNPGYYLVAGSATTADQKTVTAACALSTAAPTVEVKVKADAPTLEKKIVENNTLTDANNAAIGDTVNYRITSRVPNMTGYEKYYFIVHDTLSKGLSLFNAIAADEIVENPMKIKIADVDENTKKETILKELTLGNDYTIEVKDKEDIKEVDGQEVKETVGTEITITFKNFIQYKEFAGKAIIIDYSAVINGDAVIGNTGNDNIAKLEYSNNPNINPEGEDKPGPGDKNVTGVTPDDKVITYVTGIELTKIDAASKNHLVGATFEITGEKINKVKILKDVFNEATNGTYYKLKDGTYTETASDKTTENNYVSTTTKYEKEVVVEWNEEVKKVSAEGVVNSDGVIRFDGLSAGTYKINEIIAPDGYNRIIDPIEVKINFEKPVNVDQNAEAKWTYTASGKDSTGEEFSLSGENNTEGRIAFNIENNKGTLLPSTGGIGTTIFYAAGIILMAGAVFFVVRRKKA